MSHEKRLSNIREQLSARPKDMLLAMQKPSRHMPYHFSQKMDRHPIDISFLNYIIEIDLQHKTATVEGTVTLEALCRATLDHQLMPAVIPEFENFTIAGLINGLGVQSTSHQYGLFPNIILEMEVMLANGDLLIVSRDQHADLFDAIIGSRGTIGIVTQATLKLIDTKPYVRSHYLGFKECSVYVDALQQAIGKNDFVEGIIYGPNEYVLITSNFSTLSENDSIYHAMKPGNPWYYQHVQKMSKNNEQDLVPIYEYLFRHQRSLFWMIPSLLPNFLCHHYLVRKATDILIETSTKKIGFQIGYEMPLEFRERNLTIQDLVAGLNKLELCLQYINEHIGIYPIWNCPVKNSDWLRQNDSKINFGEYGVDVGIYGLNHKNFNAFIEIPKLQQLSELASAYGTCYFPEKLLTYDMEKYEEAREKYSASDAYPHLYDKCINKIPENVYASPDYFYKWRMRMMFIYKSMRVMFSKKESI